MLMIYCCIQVLRIPQISQLFRPYRFPLVRLVHIRLEAKHLQIGIHQVGLVNNYFFFVKYCIISFGFIYTMFVCLMGRGTVVYLVYVYGFLCYYYFIG